MATLNSLVDGVRNLIEDYAETSTDVFSYTTSNIFTISEPNATSVEDVRVNDISSSVSYTYSSSTQKITITSSLSTGDSIAIDFTYFNNYSSSVIQNYLKSALIHISTRNYKIFELLGTANNIYPEPTDKELNLISMVASILIDPPKKSLRLPDLTINYADNLSKTELINQTISIFKHYGQGVFSLV